MAITKKALKRIEGIHQLSGRVNGRNRMEHEKKLLALMRHHIEEIEQLYCQRDGHYLVETGDLAMLCFEMLLEGGQSPDTVLETCIKRYEKKLKSMDSQPKR